MTQIETLNIQKQEPPNQKEENLITKISQTNTQQNKCQQNKWRVTK